MLGLSGGIGPLRASVSTRGVGGSVGPLNFGAGFSGGGGLGAVGLMFGAMLAAIAASAALVVIGWPLLLSMKWIGGVLGIAIGVVLELAYLVAVLVVWAKREDARESARDARREAQQFERIKVERAAAAERANAILEQAPSLRAAMETKLSYMRHRPAGFPVEEMQGLPDDFPRDEKFLGAGTAWLSAGRVAYRGGPRVQTDIECGSWSVSDRCIRFRGATRTDKWPLDALNGVFHEPGRILFGLDTRSTITGLSAGDPKGDLLDLRIALEWARALPGPPIAALALVESELADFDASMLALREELELADKNPSPTPAT